MEGLKEKNAGNAAFQLGDFETALEWYDKAITANPGEATYYANRCAALCKLNRFAAALQDAEKCVQFRPEWYKAHYRLGEAYNGLKQFALARAAFEEAMRICPERDQALVDAMQKAENALMERAQKKEQKYMKPHSSVMPSTEAAREAARDVVNGIKRDGLQITTMEDYMRFRAQGGAKTKSDQSSYLTETPNDFKPQNSRAAFLASMGIQDESEASNNAGRRMGSAGREREQQSQPQKPAGGGGGSSLAEKRAELLRSMGMTGATTSGASDWSKIRGSDSVTQSSVQEESPAPSRREYTSEDNEYADFTRGVGASSAYSTPQSATSIAGRRRSENGISSTPSPSSSLGYTPNSSPAARNKPAAPSVPHVDRSSASERESAMEEFSRLAGNADGSSALPALPQFDYAAAGADLGRGVAYKGSLMEQYRTKAKTGMETSMNSSVNKPKRDYSDFSYRKLNSEGIDAVSKHSVVEGAILAEAMGGGRSSKFV